MLSTRRESPEAPSWREAPQRGESGPFLPTRGEVPVLDGLTDLIERHLSKRGAGEFTMPGLLKIKAVKRPARPARKGVPNPFKPGEMMDIPKKPASVRVKVLPLKKLKSFAEL